MIEARVNMDPLVKMSNIYKSYETPKGPLQVLKDINLQVHKGEVVSLIGPSGSGKSTCLRSINGLETIDSGELVVSGIHYGTSRLPKHKIRQKTAMVFQRFELFPHLSVIENVAIGLRLVKRRPAKQAQLRAEELLVEVGLSDQMHKYPHALSGGQQQRVGIARALATEPEVLLCDEPTSALDPELVDEVTEILARVASTGMTMIIVTHEMRFARRVADRCFFLDGGQIIETGASKDFFENPKSDRLQQFLQRVHT